MAILSNVLNEIWVLINEMAPYLLLGFLLAGLMHEYVPNTLYHRYLGGRSTKSVVLAALFGVPLPLCSCGVIPTAMGLHREGASKGATTSFLIATPQTGIDSIIATYSLMGLPFAIIRPIVAMVTAIFGGWLVNKADNKPTPRGESSLSDRAQGENSLNGASCNAAPSLGDGDGVASIQRGCEGVVGLAKALRYAFVEMMEDIGKWLVVGLVIAGLITALVPDGWFAFFQGNSIMSILFVLVLSVPMYLCATGSIPIAVALMLKGLTPGAALVLLMAGPASNAASIMVINKVMGRRTLLVYLASIVSGAIFFGLAIDYFLPAAWFTATLKATEACCEEGPGWFSIACTVLLALLLINAFSPVQLWKGGCHCHEHGSHLCHCHESECHCGDEEGGCHCHDEESECHCGDDIEIVIRVKGMNCNHCAANVKKSIDSVVGVERSEVFLHEKEARVAGHFDVEEVLSAIRSLGFDAEI